MCHAASHETYDLFDVERFVRAQEGAERFSTFDVALAEIEGGRKVTHWIWWVFPQLQNLGRSHLARKYGISCIEEACAYLAHPVLGPRLVTISQALLRVDDASALEVFGPIDCVKVRSCMTLFSHVPGADPVFREVLDAFYEGVEDPETLRLLGIGG